MKTKELHDLNGNIIEEEKSPGILQTWKNLPKQYKMSGIYLVLFVLIMPITLWAVGQQLNLFPKAAPISPPIESSTIQSQINSPEKLNSYWPMNLNNWWVYTTIYPHTCKNPGGSPAKTAWWVMPPDTSFRFSNSRILSMYKESPCTWNWTNEDINIRWSIPIPTKDNSGTYWFRQNGAYMYKKDSTKPFSRLASYLRPPFVTNDSYFAEDIGSAINKKLTLTNESTSSLTPVRFAGRKKTDPNYPPYLFFPYSPQFPLNINYSVGFNCNGNPESINGNWNFLQSMIPDKCNNPKPQTESVGRWLVEYTENVPITVATENGIKKFSALQFSVFEPNPIWNTAACERYSFVKNIGPVKIESSLQYMLTKQEFDDYKTRGQLDSILNSGAGILTYDDYVNNAFTKRCLNFDYNESAVDLSGNILSTQNEIYIKQVPTDPIALTRFQSMIDKKIFLKWYSVIDLFNYNVQPIPQDYTFQDFDSPDTMAITKSYAKTPTMNIINELFYAKNGKYWQYNIKEGRLLAYGNLQDVWGPKGSNAPPVVVNGNQIYPWSNNGPKAVTFAPAVKTLFNYSGLYINQGAYWLWDYCTQQEKTINPNCIGKWRGSGLVEKLFEGIPNNLNLNGKKITPFTNNGPRSVSEAWWNPNGLDIYNEGGWWFYEKKKNGKSGAWTNAMLLQNTDLSKAAVIEGVALTMPESSTLGSIFLNSDLIKQYGNSSIPNSVQKIFTQNGRYWIKYANDGWEIW